ncbi:cytoplasmic dynein 1 light intermediate chain 2-like isoform X1 [Stegodyphus dumicola]|uniref:cytoplasmic dynein 1 light intermediate chain 2-like isoform X1 n=1 Tax=Stegodyphus dumicola TaxID=202533 RepID=UPI0015B28EF3|nr:cytoplasmic dynein 1 light intermediate chain 2-like isoform X1 [Stegodyphus dumicola]
MAQITVKGNSDLKLDEKPDDDDDKNLWLDILSQVQESSPTKLPSCKALLVLGDNESGKTSLIAKLQGNEDPRKGSGLEYHYVYVRDEYRDDHTRLGVWVLDGDAWHRNLLKYVLNADTFPHTTVLLTAAMTQPWDILESLQNWALILEEHVQRLRLPQSVLEEHQSRVLKRFQDYVEPGAEIDGMGGTSPVRPIHGSNAENILSNREIKINLGLEIIVIITKTDYMSTLEKEYDFKEEIFDFIQLTIRNFCLLYGAALFYVSVKEDKNCDLLYKYLVHRIYNFPFRTPALVVEKDAVFIPAGWDNSNKIDILLDNLTSVKPNDAYNEVVVKPVNRKPLQREAEIIAEDDQVFLCRLQNLINQQIPASVGRPAGPQEPPIRSPAGVQKTGDRRISGSSGVQSSPKKIEGKAGTVGGEGVLQNFFNSLLNRRTGTTIGSPLASVRTPGEKTTRHDAVAELDRMSGRSKKTPSGFTQSSETSFDDEGGDNPSMQS